MEDLEGERRDGEWLLEAKAPRAAEKSQLKVREERKALNVHKRIY